MGLELKGRDEVPDPYTYSAIYMEWHHVNLIFLDLALKMGHELVMVDGDGV